MSYEKEEKMRNLPLLDVSLPMNQHVNISISISVSTYVSLDHHVSRKSHKS